MTKTRRDGRLSAGRSPRLTRGKLRRKSKRVNPYAGTICQRYFSTTRWITVKSTARLGSKSIQRDFLIGGKEHATNLRKSVISIRISSVRIIVAYGRVPGRLRVNGCSLKLHVTRLLCVCPGAADAGTVPTA
jgi:hypothetical protein